jgi:hypothetical protein
MKKSVWSGIVLGLFCVVSLYGMNKGIRKVPSLDLTKLRIENGSNSEPFFPRPQVNNYVSEETDSDSSAGEQKSKTKKKRGLTRNNGSDDLKKTFGLGEIESDSSDSD